MSHLQGRQDTGRGNTRFCPGPTGYWEEGHEGLASTSSQKTSNAARQGDSPGESCCGFAAAGMLQSNGTPFSPLHMLGKEGSGAFPHRKAALKGKGKQVCISHLCLETLSEGETEFRHSIRTAWALVDLPRKLALRVWGDSDVVPSWSGKHTTSVRAAGAWSQRTMALPRSSQTILLRFAVKKTSAFAEVHPMLPSTCLEWGKPSQWVMAVRVRV